ncbi:TMPIT-like protein, partial [Powellomyces hirtus]
QQRAAHFNDLARQVNAEERACLAELGKSKRAMKDLGKLIEQEQREQKHQQGPPQSLPRVLTGGLNEGEESPMQRIKRKVRHLEYQFPKPAHIILRIAIGSHAPVSLKPLQLRLAYKHEYEVFKLRFTLVFMVLSMFALFLVSSRVLDAIYGFAMLYYYATCVLREHILLVNGSRIRTWWFVHHYISIVLSGITLIWPASPLYQKFRTHFFAFSLYISAMQYLQYRYQRSRLYVLVALDRARPMDTVAGEGGFFAAEREFRLLVPFLAVGQVWQ